MRQTMVGLAVAVAATMSAAPASACGYSSCGTGWSNYGYGGYGGYYSQPSCGWSPCGFSAAAPWGFGHLSAYHSPYAVAPQYYHVNQGPTYTGPGMFAPVPTYQERTVSGLYGYGPAGYGPSYQYGGAPYGNGYYGTTGYTTQPAYTTGYGTGYATGYTAQPAYPYATPMVGRPPVRYFRRHVTMRPYYVRSRVGIRYGAPMMRTPRYGYTVAPRRLYRPLRVYN